MGEVPPPPQPAAGAPHRWGSDRWLGLALGGLGLALVALIGWYEAGLPPFTRNATLVTLGTGVAVLAVAWATARWRRSARASAQASAHWSRAGLIAWSAVAVCAVALELVELWSQPRHGHPTLSSLLNVVSGPDERLGRTIAFCCWAAIGWWIGSR